MNLAETNIAVFQFIELLTFISLLSIVFVVLLLLYIRGQEKNRNLEEANKKERLMTETITQVQENERSRISRDLHDTVTQDIRTALLYTHKLNQSENLPPEEKSLLQKIQKIEEENLKSIRNIIQNLTPSEIENTSIVQLLFNLCENTKDSSGLECKFYAESKNLPIELTTEQKLHIFRIVQESITNAVKHSKASEISVIVRTENEEADGANDAKANRTGILFLVSDDEIGIAESSTDEKEEPLQEAISKNTHLGIKGMKNRAALLGARLDIKTSSETGTQVKLFVPGKVRQS